MLACYLQQVVRLPIGAHSEVQLYISLQSPFIFLIYPWYIHALLANIGANPIINSKANSFVNIIANLWAKRKGIRWPSIITILDVRIKFDNCSIHLHRRTAALRKQHYKLKQNINGDEPFSFTYQFMDVLSMTEILFYLVDVKECMPLLFM